MYACMYVFLCVYMHVSFVGMYIYIAPNYFGFAHISYMFTYGHVCNGECMQTFRCMFLIVHTLVLKFV